MKTLITGTLLFATTISAIAFFPSIKAGTTSKPPTFIAPPSPTLIPERHVKTTLGSNAAVDVVFVLDTTSSMSGMIDTAKEKIWSIATTMTAAQQTPDIRIGLVGFRDRGDSYVTHTVDLSSDIDSVYAALMDFQAQGGGDGPESVNEALDQAINAMSWQPGSQRYQSIFLVGDAPPHMDYENDKPYQDAIQDATNKGIVVNTIQCGDSHQTARFWQEMAQLGEGRFFQVEQSGGAIAIDTPYDQDLARLSAELDNTRVYYGNAETRSKMSEKMAATAKLNDEASVSSLARRSAFNSSESGKKNRLGENELVEAVSSGQLEVEDLAADELPERMRAMTPTAQKAEITKIAAERKALHTKIKKLTTTREQFIASVVAKSDRSGDSLESKLFEAVRDQGGKFGLTYDKGPEY